MFLMVVLVRLSRQGNQEINLHMIAESIQLKNCSGGRSFLRGSVDSGSEEMIWLCGEQEEVREREGGRRWRERRGRRKGREGGRGGIKFQRNARART